MKTPKGRQRAAPFAAVPFPDEKEKIGVDILVKLC